MFIFIIQITNSSSIKKNEINIIFKNKFYYRTIAVGCNFPDLSVSLKIKEILMLGEDCITYRARHIAELRKCIALT
jgi:hypothetical protein